MAKRRTRKGEDGWRVTYASHGTVVSYHRADDGSAAVTFNGITVAGVPARMPDRALATIRKMCHAVKGLDARGVKVRTAGEVSLLWDASDRTVK